MALYFLKKPEIWKSYSKTLFETINQLLGTDLKAYRTGTYPAWGKKGNINPNFKVANEILLLGNPDRFRWDDETSFKTDNTPDALEVGIVTRTIHLFLKKNGYYVYQGKYQFYKRKNDKIILKKMS